MISGRAKWGLLVLLLVSLWVNGRSSSTALAHGGGALQGLWETSFYRVAVQTDETPHAGWLGGTIHVTVVVMQRGDGLNVRLRNVAVQVSGVGPQEPGQPGEAPDPSLAQRVGPVIASETLNGAYEADLPVRTPGVWNVQVTVGERSTSEVIQFSVDVHERTWFGDVAVVGGLMAVPVIGLIGMVRAARRRGASRV